MIMSKSKKKNEIKIPEEAALPQFTHEQLREALFHVQDVLERCLCPFFVLGNTARHMVKNEEEFTGDEEIHIGIQKASLTKEVISMMESYIPELEKTNVQYSYFHNGVPVIIDIIQGEYAVLKNPDRRFYYISDFLVPNPWSQYWQQHEFIK